MAAGVLLASSAVVLGAIVWDQSAAVAVGWLLIAVVAVAVPVRRARRVLLRRREPDAVTAGRVLSILTGLDEVEHRAVELGPIWPRLSVGPTGVLVIDVCPGALPGPARRGDTRILHARLARTAETGQAARQALAAAGVDVPVQVLAVMAGADAVGADVDAAGPGASGADATDVDATDVDAAGADATGDDVRLIATTELAGVLTAGPALPMAVVDAAFTSLARSPQLAGD